VLLTIPNFLSLMRLLLVPFFITSLVYKRMGWAFFIFISASITDVLDGYIARKFQQKSYFGSLLDPLADKTLLDGAFITLTLMGFSPAWLTITVVSRDVIIVGGVVMTAIFFGGVVDVEPTILGKATTFFQVLTVLTILLSHQYEWGGNHFLKFMEGLAFFVTFLSGVNYIYRGIKALSEEL